jgi:hypothetical protein
LLVGLVVIVAKFGREKMVRSSATSIGRGLEPLDVRTDPEPYLIGSENKKTY